MLGELATDDDVALARVALRELLESFRLVDLTRDVLNRAAQPFPTTLGTLDALHLSTALLLREEFEELRMGTHDAALARAAVAEGFEVFGV